MRRGIERTLSAAIARHGTIATAADAVAAFESAAAGMTLGMDFASHVRVGGTYDAATRQASLYLTALTPVGEAWLKAFGEGVRK